MLAVGGLPYSWNYTAYDQATNLFVRASIYDVTASFPGIHVIDVVMTNVLNGSYGGIFTPIVNKSYQIISTVYTDGTFTTPDPNRSPAAENLQSIDLTSFVAIKYIVGAQIDFDLAANEFDVDIQAFAMDMDIQDFEMEIEIEC